jgi:hypothetical protein
MFLKHLAICIMTRKYRMRQQYTDWWQNFGTQEVFVCDKCQWSYKTAEITAVPTSRSASAATTGYGWKNSILPLVLSCCTWRGSCVVARVMFYLVYVHSSSLDYRTSKISDESWSRSQVMWKCNITKSPNNRTTKLRYLNNNNNNMPLMCYIIKHFFYIPQILVVWRPTTYQHSPLKTLVKMHSRGN